MPEFSGFCHFGGAVMHKISVMFAGFSCLSVLLLAACSEQAKPAPQAAVHKITTASEEVGYRDNICEGLNKATDKDSHTGYDAVCGQD